ncbi:MAG: hypothetical protein JXQ80_06810, partial [Bacteroidales bacterium]|nr:hypothetical protein [Bacteroidales bacterium]
MKTILHKRTTIAMLAALFISLNLMAQEGDTFTREIKKEFSVKPSTRLEILNKYGNVDIVNREDPAISIDVQIKVNVKDRKRADELLDMISIEITQEGDIIRAVTNIDDDFGKYFRGFNSGKDGLQINYTVSMPKTVPVNLINKYGNVFVDELTSTSTLDIKYGKLTANKIIHSSKEPLSKILLSYSNGTIQECRWIELDIKYSKINISDSKALVILSKYSKVFVTNGTSIVSESKYDTYEIGKLNNFVTTAAYGHFSINELTGKLQVDTKYSDVLVDQIPAGFEAIKVTNSYGNYRLGITGDASYRLNGYAKYCSIIYPENISRLNRFNENNEMKITGIVGADQQADAEVNVTSHY